MTGIAETTTPTVWLDLPSAPPVPGLRFRAFRDLADYEPMSDVMCAAARADDIPWLPTADRIYATTRTDLARTAAGKRMGVRDSDSHQLSGRQWRRAYEWNHRPEQ